MQTWLVHMRHPLRLWRELGPLRFAAVQVLFFGLIGAALAHPFSIVFVFVTALSAGGPAALGLGLILVDVGMLALGYAAYAALLLVTLTKAERPRFRHLFPSVMLYWLLISLAAVRAIGQLMRAPHHWEKTPHGRSAMAGHRPVRAENPAAGIAPI